jgi:hypothetical protein
VCDEIIFFRFKNNNNKLKIKIKKNCPQKNIGGAN